MQIAINTVCLVDFPWEEALVACKTAGFSRIELLSVPGWAHVDARTADADALLVKAERLGVQYVGLHAGGIDGTNEETLAESLSYLQHGVELASKLGCSRIVFTGAARPTNLTAESHAALRARITRGLALLSAAATARGLHICLENHYRCQVETLEDYLAILAALSADSPVMATIDTGHFTASQVDQVAVITGLSNRIGNVHVKDHIGTESVGLGYGDTNNAAVIHALQAIGYTGDLTVELEVHDRENALRYVREAYPYMQSLISSI